jgi:predicted metalloprotease with PDZ domain
MCDNLHLNSIQQCETPLNTLFFSEFNKNLLQRGIRQAFKNKTGISIDYQNPDDLFSLMRVVFINNSGDQYSKVNDQVRYMNTKVIATALSQIQTGVSQYIAYAEDIDTISAPMDRPVNTSTMGKKIDFNNKIGIN